LVLFKLYRSTNHHRFFTLLSDEAELQVATFCSCQ